VKRVCERECGKWGVGVSVVKRVFRNPLACYITTTQCYINLAERWGCHAIPLCANICIGGGWITASPQAHAAERE